MEDVIVEPVRSILIPGFEKMKKAAIKAGALGCSISGSGPSVFALSTSKIKAKNIGESMQSVLHALNIKNEIYISKINHDGPRIIRD